MQPPKHSAPKIGFVSLGCPKALVDSEQILTQLRAEGYETSSTYEDADLVVVNTCGFIDSAVEESLDAIGEALAENGKVIVTGCLGAKGGGEVVKQAHPQVLAVTGPHALPEVMAAVHMHLPQPHDPFIESGAAAGDPAHAQALRVCQDLRRLQSPLHLLHHPVHARRSGQPPDRRGHAGSGKSGQCRRQGTADHFAGHQRLWRGREIPHRFLARQAAQDPHDRAGARSGGTWRLGAVALRLPVSACG